MKGDTDRNLYTKTQKLQNYQNYSDFQMEEIFSCRKEFMVQLQTFTTSDYLLKKNCFDNNQLQNQKKKLFHSFEISKNIILTFAGHALIGQNESVDVLQLDEFFL